MRPSPPPSTALASATWEALGTSVVLRVNDTDALAPARASVESVLDATTGPAAAFAPTPSFRA